MAGTYTRSRRVKTRRVFVFGGRYEASSSDVAGRDNPNHAVG